MSDRLAENVTNHEDGAIMRNGMMTTTSIAMGTSIASRSTSPRSGTGIWRRTRKCWTCLRRTSTFMSWTRKGLQLPTNGGAQETRRRDKETDKGRDFDKHEIEEEPLGVFLSKPLPERCVVVLNRARSSLDGWGENVKRTHKRREEAKKKLREDTQESTRGLDTLSMLYKRFEYSQDKLRYKTNKDEFGGDHTPRSSGWCPRCTGRDETYPVQSSGC